MRTPGRKQRYPGPLEAAPGTSRTRIARFGGWGEGGAVLGAQGRARGNASRSHRASTSLRNNAETELYAGCSSVRLRITTWMISAASDDIMIS